jgi:hypothetical protein
MTTRGGRAALRRPSPIRVAQLVLVGASLLLILAAVALPRDAAGTAGPPPRLALERTQPLTVKGRHFRAHERVRLVVHEPIGIARRVRADGRGRFRKVFRSVVVDRCGGLWVGATGSAGSRARLVSRSLPECAPR